MWPDKMGDADCVEVKDWIMQDRYILVLSLLCVHALWADKAPRVMRAANVGWNQFYVEKCWVAFCISGRRPCLLSKVFIVLYLLFLLCKIFRRSSPQSPAVPNGVPLEALAAMGLALCAAVSDPSAPQGPGHLLRAHPPGLSLTSNTFSKFKQHMKHRNRMK